ncbi:hypothetical protein WOB65_17950 [Vibrio parahaemolyticus]|nr:hypothetical protein [Vibrio parahaemolyticus]HCH6157717.1 hypothetical protein [Vibrio parahaemolyticus]
MRIRCINCGVTEEVNLDLFVKIMGGATTGFGFWAWVSFLFAGTGFAMAICIAIVGGGAAMLVYKDEIIDWIINRGYECESCNNNKWIAVSPEVEKEINAQKSKIESLKKEAEFLTKTLTEKEEEIITYLSKQDSSFSMEDVEELLGEIEEKESKIEVLLKNKCEWEVLKKSLILAQENVTKNLEKKFSVCYSSLSFSRQSLKRISRLTENDRMRLEQQLGFLQHNPQSANFRDNIIGTNLKELGFSTSGRIYIQKEGSRFLVVCVGNKNSQNADIKHLRHSYNKS